MEGVIAYNQDKNKISNDNLYKLIRSKSVHLIQILTQMNGDNFVLFKSRRSKIYNDFLKYLNDNNYKFKVYDSPYTMARTIYHNLNQTYKLYTYTYTEVRLYY